MYGNNLDTSIYFTPYVEQISALSRQRASGQPDDLNSLAFVTPLYFKRSSPSSSIGAHFHTQQNEESLEAQAAIPQHTVLESPTGQKIKKELNLPLKEHSATDFLKAALNFPYSVIAKGEDKYTAKYLRKFFDTDLADEAMIQVESIAKKIHLDKAVIPQAWKDTVKKRPEIAFLVGLAAFTPGFYRVAKAYTEGLQNEAAIEADERAHSHQTLESPTGQKIKKDLGLPYKKHSQFDFPEVARFFEELQLRYPGLSPLRGSLRDIFRARTNILKQLADTPLSGKGFLNVDWGNVVRMTTRALLYAEGIDRHINLVRPFSPYQVLSRMVRSAVGAEEEHWAELALTGVELSPTDRRYIKLLGLGLGTIESYHAYEKAYDNIHHFLTHHVEGPYEDRDQKAEDKRRALAIAQWKAGGKYKNVKESEGSDLIEEIGAEAKESLDVHHALGHALHILAHPGQHTGAILGIGAFSSVGAYQLASHWDEIVSEKEGRISRALEVLSEGHAPRTWAGAGAIGLYGAITGHNWKERLRGFGALSANFIGDKLADRVTDYAIQQPKVQEFLAKNLRSIHDSVVDYLELEKPGPFLSKLKGYSDSLEPIIAARKAGVELDETLLRDLEKELQRKLRPLGQETVGAALELVLWPVLSHVLGSIGSFVDSTSTKASANRAIKRQVRRDSKGNEEEKESQKLQKVSPRKRRTPSTYSKPIEKPRQTSNTTPQPPQEKIRIHTHHEHQDEAIDLQVVQQAHSQMTRRGLGGVKISYSDMNIY